MKPNCFYKFTPRDSWCREGMAFVGENGRPFDTFWGSSASAYENGLKPDEIASAELYLDLEEFAEMDQYASTCRNVWEQFHPDDRRRVTSQHGLQSRYFLRKGALPDLKTKIENAKQKLEECKSKLRSAERGVEWAQRELIELIGADTPPTKCEICGKDFFGIMTKVGARWSCSDCL